jgi:hypothetical protein
MVAPIYDGIDHMSYPTNELGVTFVFRLAREQAGRVLQPSEFEQYLEIGRRYWPHLNV